MSFPLGQSVTLNQSQELEWLNVQNAEIFALHAVVSNSAAPVGTLRLEASCETYAPTNQVAVTDSDLAVSGDDTFMWDIGESGVKWIRVSYVRTSGNADLVVFFNTKEEK